MSSDDKSGQGAETELLIGTNAQKCEVVVTAIGTSPIIKSEPPNIQLNAEFKSFLDIRAAIERYQKENSVQLIVKDSKLLAAESTRRVIPKVYHLVNKKLMYHSITYCCKCHGELKQKPVSRVKNVGAKRLNCPMYVRLKLTPDLQKLVIFDLDETHNHGIDPNTCLLPPRQQVYKLSKMRKGQPIEDQEPTMESLIASAIKDVTSVSDQDYQPSTKRMRIKQEVEDNEGYGRIESPSAADPQEDNSVDPFLDSESSCSDSDDEDSYFQSQMLPYPIRLIGSAIKSSPELIVASKELIELQKSNLLLEKQKIILQSKKLELENLKLEMEVKIMERNLANEMESSANKADTTIYLQSS